jgi:sugar lactone lactonase YvrE
MQAPNDLAVAPGGTVVFTDPGLPPTGGTARIMSWAPGGKTEILAGGFQYTNGIAIDGDGSSIVVVVDDIHLTRFGDLGRGPGEPAIEHLGDSGGDGVCLDVEGRYYVAARRAGGVRVFEGDGTLVDFLAVEPGNSFVTNCCFGGEDGRTLYATDARRGWLVAWDALPTAGLPVAPWTGEVRHSA